jgi:hypothetical protein
VIRSTNLSPGNFIQSDFDNADKIYVPSTFASPGPTEAYLTAVNTKGYLDNGWGKRYSFTGNERCMASKVVTGGDVVVAGTTSGSNGNSVVFVMRVQNNGTLLWARYFDQSLMTVDHRVVVTETNISEDIVVAASSENTDNHVLIRLNKTGGLIYYDDHAMYAAPNAGNVNPDEYFAVINGITATSDDGYVVVGCTGEFNSDFYAATAMKYDANFSSGGSHAPAWLRTYRHKPFPIPLAPIYDLNQPGHRSSTFAKGVMMDPSGEIVVVGYQGDHDRNFLNATYQKGFIWVLDGTTGGTNNMYNYDLPNFLVSFNGIALDNNNSTSYRYIVTGSVSDLAGNNSQTLLARIQIKTASAPFTIVSWANTYGGGGSKSEGFNAFYNAATGTYLSVGISDENSPGTPQHHVISVEAFSGTTPDAQPACHNPIALDRSEDVNDKIDLVEGTSTRARATIVSTSPVYDCATMYQLCGPECVQTPPTPYYSRVLTAHINQNFLKADFNQSSNMAFVPANYDGGIGTSDPFWSKVNAMSTVQFSKRYNLTGSENTRAIKESDVAINNPSDPHDVLIAGTTVNSNGNHILYVMRTDYLGNPIWYRQYDQNNTDITGNVVLAESAIRKDVVVMASGGGGSNSYIHLRLDRWGTIHYYQDFPVFANGNAAETDPVINDIEATSDDGYVIVGSSGHNNDFVAAVAYKYDAGYNIISVHSLNWTYTYRRQSAGYNLNIPGQRSWNEANGVTEDALTGEIFIVGTTSDRGVTPFTENYRRGFITKLSSGGSVIKQRIFYNEQNFQVDFNDIIKDLNNDLVVTGDAYDPNHQWYHTLLAKFEDDLIFTTDWAYLYESFGMSKGFSVFENINSPSGYLSIGITNYKDPEFYTHDGFSMAVGVPNGWGRTAPHMLSVMSNGKTNTNCYFATSMYGETTQNDPVALTDGFATGATITDANVPVQPSCVFMTELCTGPFIFPQNRTAAEPTGLNEPDQAGTGLLKLYPNPANEAVTVEMRSELQGSGQILVQDLQGRTILTRNIHFTKGTNRFGVDLTNLDDGIYLIRITDHEQKMNFPVSKIQKY